MNLPPPPPAPPSPVPPPPPFPSVMPRAIDRYRHQQISQIRNTGNSEWIVSTSQGDFGFEYYQNCGWSVCTQYISNLWAPSPLPVNPIATNLSLTRTVVSYPQFYISKLRPVTIELTGYVRRTHPYIPVVVSLKCGIEQYYFLLSLHISWFYFPLFIPSLVWLIQVFKLFSILLGSWERNCLPITKYFKAISLTDCFQYYRSAWTLFCLTYKGSLDCTTRNCQVVLTH